VLASALAALFLGAAFCEIGGAGRLAAFAAACLAGAFSKESGAWLPAILPAFLFASGVPLRTRRFGAALGISILAVAAMIAARALVLGAAGAPSPFAPLSAAGALGLGARYAIVPHPLGLERAFPSGLATSWLAGLAALLGVAAACVAGWRRGLDLGRAAAFGAFWWAVAYAPSVPASAVLGVVASRYLYVPAAGLAIAAAAACAARGRPAAVAASGLAAAWLLFSLLRVQAWSDDFHLWSREVELAPDRAPSLVNLSYELRQRGEVDKAAALLERAAAAAHRDGKASEEANARANLCAMLTASRRLDEALAECTAAVRGDPALSFAWLSLGNLHASDGAWDKALRCYTRASELAPSAYRPMVSVAGAAASVGDRALALRYLELAGRAAAGSEEFGADFERRRALVLERLEERAAPTQR
jgi:tetratricopeptide (TPR) repeat protein